MVIKRGKILWNGSPSFFDENRSLKRIKMFRTPIHIKKDSSLPRLYTQFMHVFSSLKCFLRACNRVGRSTNVSSLKIHHIEEYESVNGDLVKLVLFCS